MCNPLPSDSSSPLPLQVPAQLYIARRIKGKPSTAPPLSLSPSLHDLQDSRFQSFLPRCSSPGKPSFTWIAPISLVNLRIISDQTTDPFFIFWFKDRVRPRGQHFLPGGKVIPGRVRHRGYQGSTFPPSFGYLSQFFWEFFSIHPLFFFNLCQLGSTAIGLKTKEGVVLAVEKRVTSPLLVSTRLG